MSGSGSKKVGFFPPGFRVPEPITTKGSVAGINKDDETSKGDEDGSDDLSWLWITLAFGILGFLIFLIMIIVCCKKCC